MKTIVVVGLVLAAIVVIASATVTCPPDCNGHGTRLPSGSCQCQSPWYGSDCQYNHDTKLTGTCQSTGDPHYKNFGSAVYSYMGKGIYHLIYTNEKFNVQEWHTPYALNSAAEVNRAIFIHYADTYVFAEGSYANHSIHVIVNGRSFYLSDDTRAAQIQPIQVGDCRITSSGGGTYILELTSLFGTEWRTAQFKLQTGRIDNKKQTFVNIYISLDPKWTNRVQGLCDRFLGGQTNTILPRGATTPIAATQANVDSVFGPSWRVRCNEVGFSNFSVSECGNAPAPIPVPPSCDIVQEKVSDVCSLACPYREQCEYDVKHTCSLAAAQTQIAAFETLRTTQKWDQCGGTWCNPCNGHGTCNNGKCTCQAGWTGNQCQTMTEAPRCTPACVNGYCGLDGQCHCYAGYKGQTCAQPDTTPACPGGCGKGTCTNGVCKCDPEYYGEKCDKRVPCSKTSATCSAQGDPHYDTFDNYMYSYQGHGAFYMVYSSELLIQAWHEPWVSNTNNLIQKAIAVKASGTLLELYAGDHQTGPRVKIDGQTYAVESLFSARGKNEFTYGNLIVKKEGNWAIRVTLKVDGTSYIRLRVSQTGGNQNYIDSYVTLGKRFFGQVTGLCGTWDANSQNELTPRGGRSTTDRSNTWLYSTFGPSWHVPCNEMLFTNAPSDLCQTLPSPVTPQEPGRCEAIGDLANRICRAACTSFQQCVHDVNAACNVNAAAGHLAMQQAVAEVWQGPECLTQPPVCLNDCNGRGTCMADGVCVCKPGFSGLDCAVEDCPGNCNGHGICEDGVCCCQSWWLGDDCNTPRCTSNCNGHGSCVGPDKCECYNDNTRGHWNGTYCNQCASPYYGENCNLLHCPNDCSGHGTCNSATGTCTCENNWGGDNCATFTPNLNQLTPVVQCRLPGPDVLPGSTAALVFGVENVDTITFEIAVGDKNKFAPGAADRGQGTSFAPGTTPHYPAGGLVVPLGDATSLTWTLGVHTATGDLNTPLCQIPCLHDCSGHGQCIVGQCVCSAGYSGEDCSGRVGELLPSALCVIKHTNNTNTAFFSYSNANEESISVPVGPNNNFSPAPANRGQPTVFEVGSNTPKFGVTFPAGTSLTFTLGDRNVTVDDNTCPCHVPCPNDCSGHGLCDSGVCFCNQGYTGADCSIVQVFADEVFPTYTCVAHPCTDCPYTVSLGYDNKNVAPIALPVGAQNSFAPLPANRGQPTQFAVGPHSDVFNVEWDGSDLVYTLGTTTLLLNKQSTPCAVPCPNGCSGHGTCDTATGVCTCNTGFAGADCSVDNRVELISPSVICVGQLDAVSFIAFFGYNNQNSETINVPNGANNELVPASTQSTITNFLSGVHGVYPSAIVQTATFSVGNSVAWKIGSHFAVASESSPACQATEKVVPALECVVDNNDGSFSAFFSYNNPNPIAVVIPVGSENFYSPDPADRGQPTVFFPGKTAPYPDGLPAVVFDPFEDFSWQLNGFSASANFDSIRCSDLPPVAPSYVSGHMTNALNQISVTFNQPVVNGVTAATRRRLLDESSHRAPVELHKPVPCASYIEHAALQALGQNPRCEWTSSSTLAVTLGQDPHVELGSEVTISVGGMQMPVVINAPVSPMKPVALIKHPNSIVNCESLVLDGAVSLGGGASGLDYAWSVISAPSKDAMAAATAQLATQNTAPTVTLTNLFPGTYMFSLTVSDFLGGSNTTVATVAVQNNFDAMSVDINSPSQVSVQVGDAPIHLTARARFPCQNAQASDLQFSWRLMSAGSTYVEVGTSSQLVLPTTTLVAGRSYSLSVVVSAANSVRAQASISINVHAGPVTARIVGAGVYTTQQSFALNAASSVDSHTGDSSSLTFTWSCRTKTGNNPCTTPAGTELRFNQQSSIVVSAGSLAAGNYIFSVVAATQDSRSDVVSAEVSIVDSGISVSIAPVGGSVDAGKQLVLHADVDGAASSLSLLWTRDTGDLAGTDDYCYLSSTSNVNLVIAAGCLLPGSSYKFTVKAVSSGTTVSTSVSFTTLSGPVGGRVSMSATSGNLDSDFTVTASGWNADKKPLSYVFTYKLSDSDNVYTMSAASAEGQVTTYLPAGIVTVGVEVTDAAGHSSSASAQVTVAPETTQTLQSMLAFANSELPACVSAQNYDRCIAVVSRIVFFLTRPVAAGRSSTTESSQDQQLRSQLLLDVVNTLATAQQGMGSRRAASAVILSLLDVASSELSHISGAIAEVRTVLSTIVRRITSAGTGSQNDIRIAMRVIGQVISAAVDNSTMYSASRSAVSDAMQHIARAMVPGQRPVVVHSPTVSTYVASVARDQLHLTDGSTHGPNNEFRMPGSFGAHLLRNTQSSSVSVHVATWQSNPHAWAPRSNAVVSQTVSMTVYDGDNAVAVHDLPESIEITIPRTSHVFLKQPVCAYWDEQTNSWSQQGCTYALSVHGNTENHVCLCNHLTDFAVLDPALMEGPLPVWALALIALAGLIVVTVVVMAVVLRIRRGLRASKPEQQFTAVRLMSQDELAAAAARPQV